MLQVLLVLLRTQFVNPSLLDHELLVQPQLLDGSLHGEDADPLLQIQLVGLLLEGQSSPITEDEIGPRSVPLLNRLDECASQGLLLADCLAKVCKHACFEPQL